MHVHRHTDERCAAVETAIRHQEMRSKDQVPGKCARYAVRRSEPARMFQQHW